MDNRTGKKKKKVCVVIILLAVIAGTVIWLLHHFTSRTNFLKDDDVQVQTETETEKQLHAADVYDTGHVVRTTEEQRKGTYTLLVIGGDTPEAEAENSRKDAQAVILMVVNHNRGMCYFASMRPDLYVQFPGPEEAVETEKDSNAPGMKEEGFTDAQGRSDAGAGRAASQAQKWPSEGSLGHAYALGGGPLLSRTIEENYGIPVDNYASISFKDVARIIEVPEFENLDVSEGGLQVIKDLVYSLNAVKPAQVAGYISELLPFVTHNIAADRMMKIILQVPAIVGYYSEEENIPYDGMFVELDGYAVPDLGYTTQRMHEVIY